jgi:MYXO-CTERM domain-containing protein
MRVLISAILALTVAATVNANIISHSCADDGDGAIVMNTQETTWADTPDGYKLNMYGTQYGYPAHLGGDFCTDTETDPTVWIVESVDNETGFTWTDYHIAVGMNKSFSITGVVAPPDWTSQITAPQANLQMPNNPPGTLGWVGYVDYYAGTTIAPGQSGDFGVVVSFLGTVAFSTEQVPTPEPITMSLLGLGGLALLRRRTA